MFEIHKIRRKQSTSALSESLTSFRGNYQLNHHPARAAVPNVLPAKTAHLQNVPFAKKKLDSRSFPSERAQYSRKLCTFFLLSSFRGLLAFKGQFSARRMRVYISHPIPFQGPYRPRETTDHGFLLRTKAILRTTCNLVARIRARGDGSRQKIQVFVLRRASSANQACYAPSHSDAVIV